MYQADITQAKTLLQNWLRQSLDDKGNQWLADKIVSFETPKPLKDFFLAFGVAPRMAGKQPLQLSASDLADAQNLRSGLNPTHWTTDQTTRILILLLLPHRDKEAYVKALDQLFTTAEVGELTALYLAIPLLPYPKDLHFRATEGVRSNMSVVFNALALDNPYPAEYMNDGAWNQLVMKAIFIGSPLRRIKGLDKRANATLARILRDFAHERWAAGRPVTPELWRLVTPFVNDEVLPDLERLFQKDSAEAEQQAAALACVHSGFPAAETLAQMHRPDLVEKVKSGALDWDQI